MGDKLYFGTVKVTLSSLSDGATTADVYGTITASYDPSVPSTQLFNAQKSGATSVKIGGQIPLNPPGINVPLGKTLTLVFDLHNTLSSLPSDIIVSGSKTFTPPTGGSFNLTGSGGTIDGTVTWTPN